MAEERARARRIATNIVALAIGVVGLCLLVLAVVLPLRGGAGFLFLSVILGALGLALAGIGFFFQLVPMKLDELAQLKRDHDARTRR